MCKGESKCVSVGSLGREVWVVRLTSIMHVLLMAYVSLEATGVMTYYDMSF